MSWQDEPGMEHLRDDAPMLTCTTCFRKTPAFLGVEEGSTCGMPQPDRSQCDGVFVRDDVVLVRCEVCHKTHAALPGTKPCAPRAWREDATGLVWEDAEMIRSGVDAEVRVVDEDTDEGRDEMAAGQSAIDQAYAEAIDVLRKQALESGAFMLFVPAVDDEGDEGVQLLSAGHLTDTQDATGQQRIEGLVMGALGALIDLAKSMGLIDGA